MGTFLAIFWLFAALFFAAGVSAVSKRNRLDKSLVGLLSALSLIATLTAIYIAQNTSC